jgi:hypothetical protein
MILAMRRLFISAKTDMKANRAQAQQGHLAFRYVLSRELSGSAACSNAYLTMGGDAVALDSVAEFHEVFQKRLCAKRYARFR